MENIEYVHEDGEVMTREKELDIKKYYLKMAFAKKPKYKNMTYSQELQCPENHIRLKQVEIQQKLTFEKICRKDGIHKDDWKDEFCLFWDGFLKGEYKSINDYLKRKN